jgi:hypothetical protein
VPDSLLEFRNISVILAARVLDRLSLSIPAGENRSPRAAAAVAALALAAALLSAFATVSYTGSDPRGTLLTAQALIEHGTFALDAYPGLPADHRIVELTGRKFYAYPPGTPLLSLPAVAVARLAGFDMARPEDDDRVQRALAALSVGAASVLASLLALRSLSWPLAVLLTGIFVFGTPVISTMGTAFWSINAMLLATMSALLLLPGSETPRFGTARAGAAGILLGFGFWCRPTASAIAAVAVVWIVVRAATAPAHRRRAAVMRALALSSAVLAAPALLVLMSRLTFGTWLPDYYIGGRTAASHMFGTALVAHLVSPSRGLLVFAPAVVLVLVAVVLWPRRVLRAPLAGLALAWVCLHLAIVSRFPHWWGGFSVGSRLMVDALPGVFVLACAAAAVVRERSRRWRAAALIALIASGAAGVWINSVEGLFNRATARWNASPSVDVYPGYALDWRLPQFLATRERLEARQRAHNRWLLRPVEPGTDYTAASRQLELRGWSAPEQPAGRPVPQSADRVPSVRFLVNAGTLQDADRLMLTVGLEAEHSLNGALWFNGLQVACLTLPEPGRVYYVVRIPRRQVRTLEYDVLESNVLEWHGADERQDGGLRLQAFRVHAAGRPAS